MNLRGPLFYLKRAWYTQRINSALSRGAATSALRNIDVTDPTTWEFCAFSQNGEDGILDYLSRKLTKQNRYFVEIGSGDGIENNSAWFAIARKYSGVMVEGNPEKSHWSKIMVSPINIGVKCYNLFVSLDLAQSITDLFLHKEPDIFSLDIDGNDYYIAQALFESGFRPKIVVVEYNSVYGPTQSLTVEYKDNFNFVKAHKSQLYFGVSVTGWKNFFLRFGYQFVTVDLNGINAFFIDRSKFDHQFVNKIKGIDYQENHYQMHKFKLPWQERFKMIQSMNYMQIE